MARTALTVQEIARTGLTPSFSAANADGHSINNTGGRMFVEVKNTDASPITVTVLFGKTIDGQDTGAGREVTVAASGDKMIGPFPTDDYNQSDGTVYVNFSAVTNVTCGAFYL